MDLPTIWFCIVSVMVAMYVVFDGFDIGAGIVYLFSARNDEEKRKILKSIGPVWDGNEVWLLAGGGVLYFAFPAVYARSFSGFYLPLMMVLWLLIGRAVSLELRNHLDQPLWKTFFDKVFGICSLLLAIFFGAALGNVVRGVPMESADGRFFSPLWTNFGIKGDTGILDWYTVLVGVAAFVVLSIHGMLWVVLKTDGEMRDRLRGRVQTAWWALGAITIVLTLATFIIQPHVKERIFSNPILWIFPLLAIVSFLAMRRFNGKGAELKAFLASALFIVGLLTSAVAGLYPFLLPSNTNPEWGLTVANSAAPAYGLKIGLMWWIPGMTLVAIYFQFVYRQFRGKVSLTD